MATVDIAVMSAIIAMFVVKNLPSNCVLQVAMSIGKGQVLRRFSKHQNSQNEMGRLDQSIDSHNHTIVSTPVSLHPPLALAILFFLDSPLILPCGMTIAQFYPLPFRLAHFLYTFLLTLQISIITIIIL